MALTQRMSDAVSYRRGLWPQHDSRGVEKFQSVACYLWGQGGRRRLGSANLTGDGEGPWERGGSFGGEKNQEKIAWRG